MLLLDPLPERRRLRRGGKGMERERILRAHQSIGVGQRQVEDSALVHRLLDRLHHRAAEDRDVLHTVLGDQPVHRGHALGDHVFVVVGDDLELVFLVADGETALSVDLVEDKLGRVFVGNSPGSGRTGERRRNPESDDVLRQDGFRREGGESGQGEKRYPNERALRSHRYPSSTRVRSGGQAQADYRNVDRSLSMGNSCQAAPRGAAGSRRRYTHVTRDGSMGLMTVSASRAVSGYCSFCAVHGPVVTTVDAGARPQRVEPDRSHPHGGAICAKGRAAPEFHDHRDRVNFPMRRTRPKTSSDPGWQRCSWDEALDLIAAKLLEVRASSGAQAVAFNKGTTGGTALTDTERWLQRLTNHFGTPNIGGTTHLCQWPRDTAGAHYTFGTPALPMPDVLRSACIVVWGSNPNGNFLTLATDIAAAKARGARLLVVDPRRVGLANKADVWLQVRPGTDGALALGLIHLLIRDGGYDSDFVREWTNAPFLVRDDTGMLLTGADLDGALRIGRHHVAAVEGSSELVVYDAERGVYAM